MRRHPASAQHPHTCRQGRASPKRGPRQTGHMCRTRGCSTPPTWLPRPRRARPSLSTRRNRLTNRMHTQVPYRAAAGSGQRSLGCLASPGLRSCTHRGFCSPLLLIQRLSSSFTRWRLTMRLASSSVSMTPEPSISSSAKRSRSTCMSAAYASRKTDCCMRAGILTRRRYSNMLR